VQREVDGDAAALVVSLVEPLAHVVLAAIDELALLVARSADPEAAMRSGSDAIDELLRRLLG
jgi:hypothetical protein